MENFSNIKHCHIVFQSVSGAGYTGQIEITKKLFKVYLFGFIEPATLQVIKNYMNKFRTLRNQKMHLLYKQPVPRVSFCVIFINREMFWLSALPWFSLIFPADSVAWRISMTQHGAHFWVKLLPFHWKLNQTVSVKRKGRKTRQKWNNVPTCTITPISLKLFQSFYEYSLFFSAHHQKYVTDSCLLRKPLCPLTAPDLTKTSK